MTHDELAMSLAEHLRGNTAYRTWLNMQMADACNLVHAPASRMDLT